MCVSVAMRFDFEVFILMENVITHKAPKRTYMQGIAVSVGGLIRVPPARSYFGTLVVPYFPGTWASARPRDAYRQMLAV